MSLGSIASIATIVGTISIFITLIFVIIELHKNLNQFRLIREISLRDVQTTFYNHWSEPHNAELVVKGNKSFDDLTEVEKYRFENYFETRMKLIAFALNVVRTEENKETFFKRIGYWFSQPGINSCYESLLSKHQIPKRLSDLVEKGKKYS
jgi:hypothetical protein